VVLTGAVVWLSSLLAAAAPDFDLIIEGGRIVDGTGNPSFVADVGLRSGRIAALGRLTGRTAGRSLVATGLAVAPGFIDIDSHAGEALLVDGKAESMIRQGVTSLILGEAVWGPPSAAFPELRQLFARLLRDGVSPNVGSLVNASQIWTEVHGPRAGPASEAAVLRMRDLVQAAMAQGALGVSTWLSAPPGAWIDTRTLIAMGEAAAPHGGLFATHLRSEGEGVRAAIDEALEIGRRTRMPVEILHLKIAERKLWGRMSDLVVRLAAARDRGIDVQADVYPYYAGQSDLAALIPPWAQEGGKPAMLARLRDPATRARIARDIREGLPGWYNHYRAIGSWQGMLLVSLSAAEHKRFQGKNLGEVIASLGGQPTDVLFDLLAANGGSVTTVYFHHTEPDMLRALQQPFVSVGSAGSALASSGPLASGHPHPRAFGTFPRVLARYVRERKVLSLEEAIRKMTSANAAKIRVYDRGLLRPGQWADLTIFDPQRVQDNADYDHPARYPTGIEYVLVNGQLVIDRGTHTGARPGAILYGPGKSP
jgi:N-acyl-D-amino-acid deacylase